MTKKNKKGYLLGGAVSALTALPSLMSTLSTFQDALAPSTYQPLTENSNKNSYVKGGVLNALSSGTTHVDANNPNQTDSVSVGDIYLDDNETVSQLGSGQQFVFSDALSNPYTGNTFAEDDQRLAKSDAKAEARPYDKISSNTKKHNKDIRQKYAEMNNILAMANNTNKYNLGGLLGPLAQLMGPSIGGAINRQNLSTPLATLPTSNGLTPTPVGQTATTPFNTLPNAGGLNLRTSQTAALAKLPLLHAMNRPRPLPVTNTPAPTNVSSGIGTVQAPQQGNDPMGLGTALQLGAGIGKALPLLMGYDKQDLHLNESPITRQQYDPSQAYQQNQTAVNTGLQRLNNTSSQGARNANLQQLIANQMRANQKIGTQYEQMNANAQTQYEQRLSQRETENNRARYMTDQIRQQDQAAYFNNLDQIMNSVANYGSAKNNKDVNDKLKELLIQTFPVGKFLNI